MKKNLFYAAFALAMMASCTNEDNLVVDPVEPTPEDKVAITLGIDSPTLIASARSTGSVGDVAVENNQWNSQRLYIAMVDKEGNVAKETVDGVAADILSWTNHEYRAPKYVTPTYADDGTLSNQSEISNTGNIRIYNDNTYDKETNQGTLHHVYYPTQGTFDFYGWHVDADENSDNGTPTIENGVAKVTGITIDGSKDIMGARTKPYDQSNYGDLYKSELTEWAFSARTARSNIKPVLKFEHQLARLKFFVKAGSDNTALKYKGDNNSTIDRSSQFVKDENNENIPMSTGAMYVTSLSALDMVNKIDMDLNKDGKIETSKAADATENNIFVLGSKGTDGQITTLTAVAPEYNTNNLPTDATEYKGTPIGESIMFFPNGKESVELQLNLTQYLKQTTNEADENKSTHDFKSQTANVLVKAANVRLDGNNANLTTFEAGFSYNVYITIYGFEEIVVDAELTPWENGGDVDVDIENDDVNNQPADDNTQTPTTPETKEITVNVTDNNGTAITSPTILIAEKDVQNATAETPVDGKYSLEVGKTYTVTVSADGYQETTQELQVTNETGATLDIKLSASTQGGVSDTYNITFTVTEKGTSNGVDAPVITISEPTEEVTVEGTTVTVPAGTTSITYTVTATGYKETTGTVEVSGTNNTVSVEMERE